MLGITQREEIGGNLMVSAGYFDRGRQTVRRSRFYVPQMGMRSLFNCEGAAAKGG